jgi:hypothetical protein
MNLPVREIKLVIERLKEQTDWSGTDPHRVLLMPLAKERSKYFLQGAEVREDNPQRTSHGNTFSLCIPIATPEMLLSRLLARKAPLRVIDHTKLGAIDKYGVRTKTLENLGLTSCDGVHNLFHGKFVVLVFGTMTNGRNEVSGLSVVSGETNHQIAKSVRALNAGAVRLHGEGARHHWHFGDAGPAMAKAFYKLAKTFGSCAVHLTEDSMNRLSSHLKSMRISSAKAEIRLMKAFPHELRDKCWTALKSGWLAQGEKKFALIFEKHHIKKCNNWMCGVFGIGTRPDTQGLESLNRHKVKKLLLAALRIEKPLARYPCGFIPIMKALIESVLPEISNTARANRGKVPAARQDSPADVHEALALVNSGMIVSMGAGVYACRQLYERGDLGILSKRTALKAAALYKKKKWSYEDFQLVSTVKFFTPSNCYPCAIWGATSKCYHSKAARILEGLSDDETKGVGEMVINKNRRRRGRKPVSLKRCRGSRWQNTKVAKRHKARGIPASDDEKMDIANDELKEFMQDKGDAAGAAEVGRLTEEIKELRAQLRKSTKGKKTKRGARRRGSKKNQKVRFAISVRHEIRRSL